MIDTIWDGFSFSAHDEANISTVSCVFLQMMERLLRPTSDGESADGCENNLTSHNHNAFVRDFLLTAQGQTLAQNRVEAINGGRSIANYLELLEKDPENKVTIMGQIDTELKAAKESGLCFNILLQSWLRK